MFGTQCSLHCVHLKRTASTKNPAYRSVSCVKFVHSMEVMSVRGGGALIYTMCPHIWEDISYHIILSGLLADNGPR